MTVVRCFKLCTGKNPSNMFIFSNSGGTVNLENNRQDGAQFMGT